MPTDSPSPSALDAAPVNAAPLLDAIEAFLARTGMSPTAFGKAAIGDPNFVLDLRRGREPRSRLIRRAEEFMQGHQNEVTAQ